MSRQFSGVEDMQGFIAHQMIDIVWDVFEGLQQSPALDNVADDVLADAILQAFSNEFVKRTLHDNVVAQRKYQRKLKGGGNDGS